jgi:hypothetical protein
MPALLGLFSLGTLVAYRQARRGTRPRTAAWYPKIRPTFAVRWRECGGNSGSRGFRTSPTPGDDRKPTEAWLECLTETLCYAN